MRDICKDIQSCKKNKNKARKDKRMLLVESC